MVATLGGEDGAVATGGAAIGAGTVASMQAIVASLGVEATGAWQAWQNRAANIS